MGADRNIVLENFLGDSFIVPLSPVVLKGEMGNDLRLVECKAHTEDKDHEGEEIILKALQDSQDYFLRRGNFDIGHYTQLPLDAWMQLRGASEAPTDVVKNAAVPRQFEIGRPTGVEFDLANRETFVTGQIYKGYDLSDWFWKTLTEFQPPMVWYPSVGGKLPRKIVEKGLDGQPTVKIVSMLWGNIGFTQQPVNGNVGRANVVEPQLLAKAMDKGITYSDVIKALDSNAVAALVKQDLEGSAKAKWGEIVERHKKFRPILKSLLVDVRGVDEDQAEMLLDRLLGNEIMSLKQDEGVE